MGSSLSNSALQMKTEWIPAGKLGSRRFPCCVKRAQQQQQALPHAPRQSPMWDTGSSMKTGTPIYGMLPHLFPQSGDWGRAGAAEKPKANGAVGSVLEFISSCIPACALNWWPCPVFNCSLDTTLFLRCTNLSGVLPENEHESTFFSPPICLSSELLRIQSKIKRWWVFDTPRHTLCKDHLVPSWCQHPVPIPRLPFEQGRWLCSLCRHLRTSTDGDRSKTDTGLCLPAWHLQY